MVTRADHGMVEVEDHDGRAQGRLLTGIKMDCVFASEFWSTGDDVDETMCEAMAPPARTLVPGVVVVRGGWTPPAATGSRTPTRTNVIHPAHTVYCVYAATTARPPGPAVANNVVDAAGSTPRRAARHEGEVDAVGGSWTTSRRRARRASRSTTRPSRAATAAWCGKADTTDDVQEEGPHIGGDLPMARVVRGEKTTSVRRGRPRQARCLRVR